MLLRSENPASLLIHRQRSVISKEYDPIRVKTYHYGPFEDLVETYSDQITPIDVRRSSRVDIIGDTESDQEWIYSSESVQSHVIVIVPDSMIDPVTINNQVNLIKDPGEIMRSYRQRRGITNTVAGKMSIEAELKQMLNGFARFRSITQPFPLGSDLFSRQLRGQIVFH